MSASLNIVILGGSGFIGRHLSNRLLRSGHSVKVYGREAFKSPQVLSERVCGCDLLIMLAGANVGQRWTKAHKQALWDSRIQTNQMLQSALQLCEHPPQRIFSASAIGIYPESDCTHPVDESCEQVGDNVLGQLGADWEVASRALQPKPVIFRFGVVLGLDGGALPKMLPAFKLGLGGPVAGGHQCFSWIHIEDLVNAFEFALAHPQMEGVYNVTSPNPVSNREFGQVLASTLQRPFWLPLPEWQLKLMFGEGAQVLTHSAAVLPTRLEQSGFRFQYPQVSAALQNLLKPA
ncbi:TIGR01777 family oxidoreductase [Thiomicrorhabdus chilensis]|uniref:TIGR01777 family oxidoreductase n=1 Tax=Thiomicrorhabdus chilensis TaxID=63656 RepID=UPI00042762BE|nr:TIGR01777 family oxidoreductase [Thiomicrorhabdus chilensis]